MSRAADDPDDDQNIDDQNIDDQSNDDQIDNNHDKEAWDAIVADLSGQIDLGPAFRPDPIPQEFHGLVDSDEFIPPEPPPLRMAADVFTRFAWAAVIIGPLLALVGFVLGWSGLIGSIGVGATIAGFFVLVARREHHVPPGYDHGDGAVV